MGRAQETSKLKLIQSLCIALTLIVHVWIFTFPIIRLTSMFDYFRFARRSTS